MPEPAPSIPSEHTLPEEAEHEHGLELLQPLRPAISLHTGGGPAMDMTTGGGVGEQKKRVCGKCTNCLACTRRAKVGE